MTSLLNRGTLLAALLLAAATLTLGGGPASAAPVAAAVTTSDLYGVSCTSPTACTAVGKSTRRGVTASLAERWNGKKWTIQRTPRPAGATNAELFGVSCTSPRACTAVGNSSRSRITASLAEKWNGKKWTIQRTPKPAGATDSELFGVSCTSPRACTAVGNSNFDASLAEKWNGTKWAVQRTPRPAGKIYRLTFFNSVSCTSPTACTAVGESDTGLPFTSTNITYLSLAERWNGKKWAIQRTPRPAAPTETFLYGVRCTSARACTAVGDTFRTTGSVVLAQRWNGSAWTVQHTPNPSALPTEFAAVWCTSATACTAVGDAYPEGFSLVAERWSGMKWAVTPTPKPAREFYAALYGVSCPAPTVCIAVGQSNNGAGSTEAPLAERWNGTTWTIQRTPA